MPASTAIDWPEGFCRRDIGWRAVEREDRRERLNLDDPKWSVSEVIASAGIGPLEQAATFIAKYRHPLWLIN